MAKQWSREDLHRLREFASAGLPLDIIAGLLGRTVSAIRNKACVHGISLKVSRERRDAEMEYCCIVARVQKEALL